jgi:hypothetical protein
VDRRELIEHVISEVASHGFILAIPNLVR